MYSKRNPRTEDILKEEIQRNVQWNIHLLHLKRFCRPRAKFRAPSLNKLTRILVLTATHLTQTRGDRITDSYNSDEQFFACRHAKRPQKSVMWVARRHIVPVQINPLNPELNPICYLLALLGAHHFLHASRIRVKLLTFRLLMSYIYGAPILDVSRSHTTTQHSR